MRPKKLYPITHVKIHRQSHNDDEMYLSNLITRIMRYGGVPNAQTNRYFRGERIRNATTESEEEFLPCTNAELEEIISNESDMDYI